MCRRDERGYHPLRRDRRARLDARYLADVIGLFFDILPETPRAFNLRADKTRLA